MGTPGICSTSDTNILSPQSTAQSSPVTPTTMGSLTLSSTPDLRLKFEPGVYTNEAISFLVEALEDPLKPRWCGPSIAASTEVICDDDRTTKNLVNGNHLFGSTIIAFLTAKRSLIDLETLNDSWAVCRCSLEDVVGDNCAKSMHHFAAAASLVRLITDSSKGRFGDVLWTVARQLACFLSQIFGDVKPFTIAKGRHVEIWPTVPQDLIPYGPETTVESLVTWSRFMGDHTVFVLVGHLVQICGSLILPAIVASKSAPNYMIEYGNQICSDLSDTSLDDNGQVEDSAAAEFRTKLEELTSFIRSLLPLPQHLNIDMHSGIERRAFDFATRAISIITSPIIAQSHRPDLECVTKLLTDYATMLFIAMREPIALSLAHLHPVICSALVRAMKCPSPAAGAFKVMHFARTLQFCFASGCLESAQSSGRVYMRCSGCHIVAYSGKSCQRRAWTDKRLPHKNICRKMAQVFDIGGRYLRREDDQDKFIREMRRAKISDSMLTEIALWLHLFFASMSSGSSHSATGSSE